MIPRLLIVLLRPWVEAARLRADVDRLVGVVARVEDDLADTRCLVSELYVGPEVPRV